MQAPHLGQAILNRQYKKKQFNTSTNLLELINFIYNLPIEKQSFDIIYDLMKFYRTPIFITFRSFYDRLQANFEQYRQNFEGPVQQIASFVKGYISGYQLEELKFFQFAGIGKNKGKPMVSVSGPEIEFIKYIEKLGKHLSVLKKQINHRDPAKLRREIDAILAAGMERKLNVLELKYEQYFKNEADRIYNEHRSQFESIVMKQGPKALEKKPEPEPAKKIPLCCRTFFTDSEVLKQPESLTVEYKRYSFPFNQTHIRTLRKTVCAFLNGQGGTIYLGVQQNVETKKRNVIGMHLNEQQKQQLNFDLRKDVFDQVQPDVITNKMYSVLFVPIKEKSAPYNFISGRYLVKIVIKYGQRNQIYSYKWEQRDYFAFRTENQVVHRYGRSVLDAYRQRLNNPLPEPQPLHEGPCSLPQQGKPLIRQKSKANQKDFTQPLRVKTPQKKKYKSKDAEDFIIMSIAKKDLQDAFQQNNISIKVIIAQNSLKGVFYVKSINQFQKNMTAKVLATLESKKMCQFAETQRGLELQNRQNFDLVVEILKTKDIPFKFRQKQNKLQFKTQKQALEAFLTLRQFTLKANFVSL